MKSQALSATFWSGVDVFVRQGLQFSISIALARLLSPEEFGTIALLYLFTGIAGAFVDGGFSAALIQGQDVTHTDESTVFWVNLGIGAVFASMLWGAAPMIAEFFALPILEQLTAVLALNVFVSALGAIHGTLLSKRLDFRVQMKIGAVSTVCSGAVAIVLASLGFGVWALACQTLVSSIVTTVLLWSINRWRPAIIFSKASVRKLFGFGGFLLASSLLDIAYGRAYTLLIGKYYGVKELGIYNRAESTKQLPVGMLTTILSRVAFPIFSAAAQDKLRLRRGVQLAVRGIMLVNVPMMLGLVAVAKPLILTLFGDRWVTAVPAMQVLCLSGILWPLHVLNLNVLIAQGHSHLFFRLEVVKKLLGIIFLLVGTYYGVMGIAWSQVMFSVIGFAINSYYTRNHLNYGLVAQTLDFLPVVGISILMMLVLFWVDTQISMGPATQLFLLVTLGSVFFLGLSWVFRLTALRDLVDLIRRSRSPATHIRHEGI